MSESVGVEFTNFMSLWDYCCVSRGWGDYKTLTAAEQTTIRNDSKERLLAYLLIANSSNMTSHESIKNNLVEAFIAKRDKYPNEPMGLLLCIKRLGRLQNADGSRANHHPK